MGQGAGGTYSCTHAEPVSSQSCCEGSYTLSYSPPSNHDIQFLAKKMTSRPIWKSLSCGPHPVDYMEDLVGPVCATWQAQTDTFTWSQFGSILALFQSFPELARVQESFPQAYRLFCLQTTEPGMNLACLTDQNSFPSLLNIWWSISLCNRQEFL